MEVKAIILSEVGQTQKDNVLHFVPLVDIKCLACSDICIPLGYTKSEKISKGLWERDFKGGGKECTDIKY